MPEVQRFTVALSPSLGAMRATTACAQLGRAMRKLLQHELAVEVTVCESYQLLEEQLLRAKVDAGWAPPLVCARVLRAGGALLAQLSRGGLGTYCSVFVCRRDRPVALKNPDGARVVWVARESTGGHLVPRAHLVRLGVQPARAFRSETFAGSYHEALSELLSGKADLTATYASVDGSKRTFSGLDELPSELRNELQVIGHTDAFPNDGLVTRPGLDASTTGLLRERLLALNDDAGGRAVLRQVFDADGLVAASPEPYSRLEAMLR